MGALAFKRGSARRAAAAAAHPTRCAVAPCCSCARHARVGRAVPQRRASAAAADATLRRLVQLTAAPLPSAMLPAVLHLLRTEGGGALFAGLGTACVSLAVSNCLYYYLYALLRDAALRATRRPALGGAAALPVASAAGALNVLLTNPLWVIVVRLQAAERAPKPVVAAQRADGEPGAAGDADAAAAADADAAAAQEAPAEATPSGVARAIWQEGGLRAFWKGTLPSLLMVSNPVRASKRYTKERVQKRETLTHESCECIALAPGCAVCGV